MSSFDLSWLRDAGLASRRENGALEGHEWALLSFTETSVHHGGRCLRRLVVFDRGSRLPLFSIDLERDILGEFCMSLRRGPEARIVARFGSAPRHEAFREQALRAARKELAAAKAVALAGKGTPAAGEAPEARG